MFKRDGVLHASVDCHSLHQLVMYNTHTHISHISDIGCVRSACCLHRTHEV